MATKPEPEGDAAAANSRFLGKLAVITGPSAHGIGGAVALRFVQEGGRVALLSIEHDSDLDRKLEKYLTQVEWVECDVTDSNSVVNATRDCLQRCGDIDIVVNNAGVESTCRFEDMSEEDWLRTIDVNLAGVLRVSQAMLPHLVKTKGVIVNISSATSFAGTPGLAAYGASKAAVNSLTAALAVEYAERRVRVVGVAPAVVRTPMIRPFVERLTADDWDQVQACHPLGVGAADDVAAAVAFLASDEARWITGVTLPLGWIPTWTMPLVQD